jgi:hypothetical protein
MNVNSAVQVAHHPVVDIVDIELTAGDRSMNTDSAPGLGRCREQKGVRQRRDQLPRGRPELAESKDDGPGRHADRLDSVDGRPATSGDRAQLGVVPARDARGRNPQIGGPPAEATEPAANGRGGQAQGCRDAPVTEAGRPGQQGQEAAEEPRLDLHRGVSDCQNAQILANTVRNPPRRRAWREGPTRVAG